MKKISIVTDSDCSLPLEFTTKLGIRQVSISIQFEERSYDTGTDIDDARMFEMIKKAGKLPSTAAPNPKMFADTFKSAFKEDHADALICFCISSAMSTTYNSACIARNEMGDTYDITVVDTQSLSAGQAFMVLAASESAKNGAAQEEILKLTEDIRKRTRLYGALATLKYLAMSGRVSQLAAGMAGMLDIKPILALQDGKLDMLEKARTKKKAWGRMIELVQLDAAGSQIEKIAIVHVNAPEDAREFQDLLRKNVSLPSDIMTLEMTPGLSVHTGEGLVGVGFMVQ
jgi:DegV family protein with EDD domain